MSVDLTGLIEQVREARRDFDGLIFRVALNGDAERDEITLALRVLRVLRHPDCDEAYYTRTGKLVFRLNGEVARRLLDEAERILRSGGGK